MIIHSKSNTYTKTITYTKLIKAGWGIKAGEEMIYCDFCTEMVIAINQHYISIIIDGENKCIALCPKCFEKENNKLKEIISIWKEKIEPEKEAKQK